MESPFRDLQNFTYALFCNRVLFATGTLKLPGEENFSYIAFLITYHIVCMYYPPLEAELKTTIAINKTNTKFIFPHTTHFYVDTKCYDM